MKNFQARLFARVSTCCVSKSVSERLWTEGKSVLGCPWVSCGALGEVQGRCQRLLASPGWNLGALGLLLWRSWGDLGGPEKPKRGNKSRKGGEKETKRREKKKRNKKERQKNENMRTCRTIWFFPIGECVRRAAESLNPKKKGKEKLQGRRGRQRGRAKDSKMAAKCVKKWSEAMQSRVKGSHLGAEDGQRGPKRVPSTSEKK